METEQCVDGAATAGQLDSGGQQMLVPLRSSRLKHLIESAHLSNRRYRNVLARASRWPEEIDSRARAIDPVGLSRSLVIQAKEQYPRIDDCRRIEICTQ
jgi:hypothetical protein